MFPGGRPDPAPCGLPLAVAHPFDLIESRDGVADVARVVERLLTFLGKSEGLCRHAMLLPGAQPGRSPFDLSATSPRALHAAGALDVLARCRLLLLGGHLGASLSFFQPGNATITLSVIITPDGGRARPSVRARHGRRWPGPGSSRPSPRYPPRPSRVTAASP